MCNKFYIIAIFLLITNLLVADSYSDAKNSAKSLGNKVNNKYASKSGVSKNLSKPLQTNSNLRTLDDSVSFNASISNSCASNNEGIRLSFSSGNNNYVTVSINQDIDANNAYDYSFNISNIENICSGGVKLADGTYYRYIFDPNSKRISLQATSKTMLSSCYCILDSCNYGGYTKTIADTITGDILAIIGSSNVVNYEVGINQYDEGSRTYLLYVKNNTQCRDTTMGNTYTSTNPKNYYNNQTVPNMDIGDVASKDNNNSSSLYYITKNQNNVLLNTSGSYSNITYTDYKYCNTIKSPYTDNSGNLQIQVNDGCSQYYSSCSLYREEICDSTGKNCVDKTLNGQITSNNIPINCINYDATTQVCADGNKIYSIGSNTGTNLLYNDASNGYFYSKKTFNCGSSTSHFDASKANNTFASVNKSSSTINYTSFDGTSSKINIGTYENCTIRYCSYRGSANSTAVYSDDTTNQNTKDGTSTNEVLYKQCTQLAGGSYTCPVGSGETLLEDCSCNMGLTGAATALAYVSAIEDAVQDFTCSTK